MELHVSQVSVADLLISCFHKSIIIFLLFFLSLLLIMLYCDVMCWMQGHLLVFAASFLVIMDSDTSSSSSVTMSYEDYYIDQGQLLTLKRGSSTVPETGGEYLLFILSSVASLTGC